MSASVVMSSFRLAALSLLVASTAADSGALSEACVRDFDQLPTDFGNNFISNKACLKKISLRPKPTLRCAKRNWKYSALT